MLTHNNDSPEAFTSNRNSALMYWIERLFPSVVTRGQYLAAMPRYGKPTGLISVRCVPGLCSSNTVAKQAATTRVQLLLVCVGGKIKILDICNDKITKPQHFKCLMCILCVEYMSKQCIQTTCAGLKWQLSLYFVILHVTF